MSFRDGCRREIVTSLIRASGEASENLQITHDEFSVPCMERFAGSLIGNLPLNMGIYLPMCNISLHIVRKNAYDLLLFINDHS